MKGERQHVMISVWLTAVDTVSPSCIDSPGYAFLVAK